MTKSLVIREVGDDFVDETVREEALLGVAAEIFSNGSTASDGFFPGSAGGPRQA